ncbi:hypothetical protein WMW72_22760 [Paenibacillus filicis]|uniref:Uncharacterized protein n=1 Tax=Paenibacillus filicis TaxID=669464 RepID=A0ABU9DPE0_9BACL
MCLGWIFYRSPSVPWSAQEIQEYEELYSAAVSGHSDILYTSKYPKYRFIQYIAGSKPVRLHGSNRKDITEFQPRLQTLFNGQYVEAVFATRDSVWALFYAVFDRAKLEGNFRNACLTVKGDTSRYYFFSLTRATADRNPWTEGMVYILPDASFTHTSDGIVSFDEWTSSEPVTPLTRLSVKPQDFYWMDKVSCHKPRELVLISWLLYKSRVRWGRNE